MKVARQTMAWVTKSVKFSFVSIQGHLKHIGQKLKFASKRILNTHLSKENWEECTFLVEYSVSCLDEAITAWKVLCPMTMNHLPLRKHIQKNCDLPSIHPFSTLTNNVSHHSEKPRLSVIQRPIALLLGLVLNTETIRISIGLWLGL